MAETSPFAESHFRLLNGVAQEPPEIVLVGALDHVFYRCSQIDRVILIPGIGTAAPDQWTIASESWLHNISPTAQRMQLVSFDHQLRLDANFSWQQVLDEGSRLLDALQWFQDLPKVESPT
jgi:hypothetical protein